MNKSSAVDSIQNIECPTEITFKLVAPQPSQSHQTASTAAESTIQTDSNEKIPRGNSGRVFKRVKPKKSSQPKRLLLGFRQSKAQSLRRTKSDDDCRHSDSLFSDFDDEVNFYVNKSIQTNKHRSSEPQSHQTLSLTHPIRERVFIS